MVDNIIRNKMFCFFFLFFDLILLTVLKKVFRYLLNHLYIIHKHYSHDCFPPYICTCIIHFVLPPTALNTKISPFSIS